MMFFQFEFPTFSKKKELVKKRSIKFSISILIKIRGQKKTFFFFEISACSQIQINKFSINYLILMPVYSTTLFCKAFTRASLAGFQSTATVTAS